MIRGCGGLVVVAEPADTIRRALDACGGDHCGSEEERAVLDAALAALDVLVAEIQRKDEALHGVVTAARAYFAFRGHRDKKTGNIVFDFAEQKRLREVFEAALAAARGPEPETKP
jgi:hypothetical protein